jgi:hypothetical protein
MDENFNKVKCDPTLIQQQGMLNWFEQEVMCKYQHGLLTQLVKN